MVRRLLGLLLTALLAAAALLGTGAGLADAATNLSLPLSRETVRYGAQDVDPYHIAHVYELQYRLARVGLFGVAPTGYFGSITRSAVKKFQKRNGLPQTGVVDHATWKPLISQSVRGKKALPAACRSAGWHACYDRYWHQVSLYHNGALLNSWLVRGGAAATPTATGSFDVFYRDVDHWSTIYHTPMPYSQFFHGGQALHGSRLMMDPFVGHSHGCVNFWVEDARQLWNLTSTKTLHVHVYGAWG